MSQDAVTVVGDKRLAATMANATRMLADMSSAHKEAGEVVRARAASNAPKRTGRLAASVTASASAGEVVVASALPYARRVNYGAPSVGQAAQPFMTNALADTQSATLTKYNRRCQVAMAQVKGA